MKIFKNEKNGSTYYTTSFYHKDQQGNETKRSVFVGFQKGLEPMGNLDGKMQFVSDDGTTYDIILDCYRKNEFVEPKFMLIKHKLTQEDAINRVEKRREENSRELKISQDELAFY